MSLIRKSNRSADKRKQVEVERLLVYPWNLLLKPQIGGTELVPLLDAVRGRHGVCLGLPGAGKTRLIEWLLVSDVIRRMEGVSPAGFCFADPHGDASEALISRLALLCDVYPDLKDLVVVVDPTRDWLVGFNPFAPIVDGDLPERIARRFADAVVSIFADDASVAVRMYRTVYYCALTLALSGGYMSDIPALLSDISFRAFALARLRNEDVLRFWSEFPTKPAAVTERTESSLNRIERILLDPDVKALFQGEAKFNFRQAMDEGKFVIVRAPRGKLSKDTSALLLSLITAAVEAAAFSREDIPERERRPFSLVADEFVLYVSDSMAEIITEGRKYKLSLLLFGQSVAQTRRNELLANVLGTVDYLMTFRLGWEDADVLYHDVFLPEVDQVKEYRRRVRMIGSLPTVETERVWRSQDDIAELMRQQIMTLPPQTLFFKRRGEFKTHRVKVLNVPDVEEHPLAYEIPKARAKLLGAIRAKYGRDKFVQQQEEEADGHGY